MAMFDKERQRSEEHEQRPPANLLNENHRRVLANTLRRVELAAWRLEDQLVRGAYPQLALTRFTHPPDPGQRSALLQLTRQIRQEVAKLAADYQLEAGEQNLLRTVMAEYTLLWSDLEDTQPRKLLAYGTINPQAQTILGPRIQRLIDLALAVDGVANGEQDVLALLKAAEGSDVDR
jgi:hypothetical protein